MDVTVELEPSKKTPPCEDGLAVGRRREVGIAAAEVVISVAPDVITKIGSGVGTAGRDV